MPEQQWYLFTDGDRYVPPNVTHLLIASNVLNIPSSLCAGNQCLQEVCFQANSSCRSIGASAFYDCRNLELVELAPTVRLIGFMAFQNCIRLHAVKMDTWGLPRAITTGPSFGLAFQCFKNCSSLTEVCIADGVRVISEACFEGCTSLRKLSLPDTVEKLLKKAFARCTNLEIVGLNQGLKSIGIEAFAGCAKLRTLPVPQSVERIGARAFDSCTKLEIVDLRHGLKSIEKEAFSHCEKLQAIPIPRSVERIGTRAFASCINLEIVGLYPHGLKVIDDEAFVDCENLQIIPIPSTVERIGSRVFENCRKLYFVELKNGSRVCLGDDIFRGCSNLIWILVQLPTHTRYYNRFHFPTETFDQLDELDPTRDQQPMINSAIDKLENLQWYSKSQPTSRADDEIEMAKLDILMHKFRQEQRDIWPEKDFGDEDMINLFHVIASAQVPRHNQIHRLLESLPIELLFREDKLGLSPLTLLKDNPSPIAHDLLLSLIPKIVKDHPFRMLEHRRTITSRPRFVEDWALQSRQ